MLCPCVLPIDLYRLVFTIILAKCARDSQSPSPSSSSSSSLSADGPPPPARTDSQLTMDNLSNDDQVRAHCVSPYTFHCTRRVQLACTVDASCLY